MKNIAFYISDHGFGHAARNIPIINHIINSKKNNKVFVKTGDLQCEFIKSSLKGLSNEIEFYKDFMDVGLILKEDSLNIDKEELENRVRDYIKSWPLRIEEEKLFLQEYKIDVVVSDIVPYIFQVTKNLNIPSFLLSNFTWVEIYKEYLSEKIIHEYKKCYSLAHRSVLYFPYDKDMKDYLNNIDEISLIAREFNEDTVKIIKEKFKRKSIYCSLGRSASLSNEINVSNLDYDFIVTEGINLVGDNVTYLHKETNNTHEYIKACDYVIAKAGWGTVAEALLSYKKLALITRDSVAEDRNTIEKLQDIDLAIKVDINKETIEEIIKRLEEFIPKYSNYNVENDLEKVGNMILYINGGN